MSEYYIPKSGKNGGPGYVDIYNPMTGELFEIKSEPQLEAGRKEIEKYVTKAKEYCPNTTNWKKGTSYFYNEQNPRVLLVPVTNKKLSSWLEEPGVILYKYENITQQPIPVPLPLPSWTLEKIRRWAQRLKNKLNSIDLDKEIAIFLEENPEVVMVIKAAAIATAVVVIVGTIVEDFLTLGAGIVDDAACFYISYRLISFAMAAPVLVRP